MRKHLLLCGVSVVSFFYALPIRGQEVEPVDSLEQTVQLLYENKPVKYINGAASYISGAEIENVPGSNRLNALAGRIPGLSFYNIDGLPGFENSTYRLRGEHTFSDNRAPIILIDGKMDDASSLDSYDIESIVLLKDAAAAGMYGLRGANGIILINTKRGKEGKIKVSFNTETSFSQPTRKPKYLDAYQYGLLYNEAQLNDNPSATPKYDAATLEAYRSGANPYKYPNVNWQDEFLKNTNLMTRNNINISGGGETAIYYVSANYLYNSGAFNVDKDVNTYNTNTSGNVMNVHGNVQLNFGKYLKVSTDIRAKREKRNAPGAWSDDYGKDLLTNIYSTPFNAHPIMNEDGSIAGISDYQKNLYGVLNHSGYSIWERSSISSYIDIAYDLSRWVKGLSIEGKAGFNTYTDFYTNRTKKFATYQLMADGSYSQFGLDTEIGNSGKYKQIYRNFDHNIGLRYTGDFDKHSVDALLLFDRQQVMNAQSTQLTQNF